MIKMSENGKVNIEISGDEMTAVAFITPPGLTGKPVEVADVKKSLEEAGVVHGIVNNERIKSFVDEGRLIPIDFLAAAGTRPGHGADASIENVWLKKDAPARIDEKGRINLRELNVVKSVSQGETIAVKTPPTRGETGMTVKGVEIPGEWGSDVSFKAGRNVIVSDDGLEFRAAISGSPNYAGGILNVDPVFVVDGDVDYSTGNINFAGALDIRGNVQDGFVVRAEGNITIGGNVQAAEVVSGGDVVVKGGIITRHEGVVAAAGSVSAKFIENSEVEAEGDVVAERAVINSLVKCNGTVICSDGEGKIMGGEIMAYNEIRAKHLGSDKESKTTLRAGFKHDIYIKMSEMEKKLEEIIEEAAGLQKNLLAKNAKPELVAEVKQKIQSLETEKLGLQQRIASLRLRVQVNPFATVKGEEYIHPGCVVYIGGSRERIANPLKFATLMADADGGVALSSYDETSGSIKTVRVGSKEKKKTVMIVDDARFMRNKLKNILENGNFRVVGEAEDGRQAVMLFQKLKPDVVTMDITMPDVDGISSLRAIKKIHPDARVVMISALGQKEKVRDSLVAGARDFIIKPFIPEKVIDTMTKVLEKTN